MCEHLDVRTLFDLFSILQVHLHQPLLWCSVVFLRFIVNDHNLLVLRSSMLFFFRFSIRRSRLALKVPLALSVRRRASDRDRRRLQRLCGQANLSLWLNRWHLLESRFSLEELSLQFLHLVVPLCKLLNVEEGVVLVREVWDLFVRHVYSNCACEDNVELSTSRTYRVSL